MLRLIANHKAYGAARRASLKNTREQLHSIRLLARRRQVALAWSAACHFAGDKVFVDKNARGEAIDDAADSFPVAFSKGSEPKEMAESIH